MTDRLDDIGFSPWFRDRLDPDKAEAHQLARVISVQKDRFTIDNGEHVVHAELSGHLFYTADSPADLPTTGDWVYADFYDDDSHAIIHGLLPRKTLLKRKTAGKSVDLQLIAANIDIAFIVQSADENFNPRRLERYLVMVNEAGITPVVLLSKCDLATPEEIDELKQVVADVTPLTSVIAFSSVTGENIERIKSAISSGDTCCLLGSSGVGKTTLANEILGGGEYRTQSVSKKQSKGRHTTTSRELIRLDNGALLIDTPGMRELGNLAVGAGIDQTFSEVTELAQACRFGDCSHSNEKGCAVQAAIASGELAEERFENYLKLKRESAHNEMSYVEKRRKDKAFGKMVKSVMKGKAR